MPWHLVTPVIDPDEAYLASAVVANVTGLREISDKLKAGAPDPEDFKLARARLAVAIGTVDIVMASLERRADPLVEASRSVARFFGKLGAVVDALETGDTERATELYSGALAHLASLSVAISEAAYRSRSARTPPAASRRLLGTDRQ